MNRRGRIGHRLGEQGHVDATSVYESLAEQRRTGARVGEVLMHSGRASESHVMEALATQFGLSFIDTDHLAVDPSLSGLLPEPFARQHRVVPMGIVDQVLLVATSAPGNQHMIAMLSEMTGLGVREVVARPSSIDRALQRAYHERYADSAIHGLDRGQPNLSARTTITRSQGIAAALLAGCAIVGLVVAPLMAAIIFNTLAALVYLAFSLYRVRLTHASMSEPLELVITDEEVAALDEASLPIYTILVPLYHEAVVARQIVAAIDRLDYPRSKLDVKLLLEADDTETRTALLGVRLPPHIVIVIVPPVGPRTKPKACNYGLHQARGTHVVIYDAEDRPEEDQLKKAVLAFRSAPRSVGCVQAKLNFYNADQNALTKWFTTEYSLWFEFLLPGLSAKEAPIPLGGTSNHFQTERLLAVGAWDPFNVTEDADLGIRLHLLGSRTVVVNSTTYEEATSEIGNWIRQRSRWMKGYAQTWLVHMRRPTQLLRRLGWRDWLSFQLMVGGTVLVALLNPLYWMLTTLWTLAQFGVIQQMFPSFLFYIAATGLFIGNFTFAYLTAVAASHRGNHRLVKYALIIPIYWGLISIAACKGVLQLITKPHFWEKTNHGRQLIDLTSPRAQSGMPR